MGHLVLEGTTRPNPPPSWRWFRGIAFWISVGYFHTRRIMESVKIPETAIKFWIQQIFSKSCKSYIWRIRLGVGWFVCSSHATLFSFASEGMMSLGNGWSSGSQVAQHWFLFNIVSWREWRVQILPPPQLIVDSLIGKMLKLMMTTTCVWVQVSKSDGANSEPQDSETDEGGKRRNAAKTSHSIRWQGNKIRRRLLQVLASRRKKQGAIEAIIMIQVASPYNDYFRSLLALSTFGTDFFIHSSTKLQWWTKLGFVVFSPLFCLFG